MIRSRAVLQRQCRAALGSSKHFAILRFDVLVAAFHKPSQRLRHRYVRSRCYYGCIQLVGSQRHCVVVVLGTVGVFTHAVGFNKFAAVGGYRYGIGILQCRCHVDTVGSLVHCIVFDNQQELSFRICTVVVGVGCNHFFVEIGDFKGNGALFPSLSVNGYRVLGCKRKNVFALSVLLDVARHYVLNKLIVLYFHVHVNAILDFLVFRVGIETYFVT